MQSGQHAAQVVPINSKNAASVKDRAKLAQLPNSIRQIRERCLQILQKGLHKVFDDADDALFTLADKATNNQEQNLYFESMREVRIRRRHMEAKFETAIDEACAQLLDEQAHQRAAGEYLADQDISLDDLSLIQNEDLEELVAVDSMVNKANTACGEQLQYLSLRIDSLVPTKVYQKNNPFGPYVVCHAFINTAQDLDADIKAKLVLFKLFDKHVVAQLPSMLTTLNQALIEQGVLPSMQSPGRTDKRSAHSRRASLANGKPLEQMTREESVAAAEDTLNALRGLMHGQIEPAPQGGGYAPASGASYAGGSAGVSGVAGSGHVTGSGSLGAGVSTGGGQVLLRGDELLGALSRLQTQQQNQWTYEAAPTAAVRADVNAFIAKLYPDNPKHLGEMENDVINLVNMLFEFILDDRNLAAPLKALIGRLQIPILKVALIDKSFFNKAGHPARRLLNEMATASLGWQEDPDNEGEPRDLLYKKIHTIVRTLLNEFDQDVGIFTDMLTDFVAFIDRERRRASVLERRTLDAEDGKAKAEAARKQVAEALESRTDGRSIPLAARKILNDAWSNVLFLLCLRKGTDSQDWQNALKTAEQLIWSVTVNVDTKTRGQLLALIPPLVKNLREGLEKISFNPFEMTQLLSQLEKLHMQRLQAPAHKMPTEAQARNTVQPIKPAAKSNADKETPAQSINVKPKEAAVEKTTNTEANKSIDTTNSKLVSKEDADAIETIDDSYLALVGKLTQGSWFELQDGQQHYRCRLAAIIKATGKYIFVNRSGMKVAEESRETLALAMKKGSLRLLDDTMLFDRALESVIGSLRHTKTS